MRALDVAPRFYASQRAHAPTGSPEWAAIARALAELADDRLALPGVGDFDTLIPPVLRCTARPLAGTGLVLCYRVDGAVVHVLAVKRAL